MGSSIVSAAAYYVAMLTNRPFVMCIALGLAACLSAEAATRKPAQPAASTASRLRDEWDIPETKLQREAVDDASFTPQLKQAATSAIDWFVAQQESLIADAAKSPAAETKARQVRAKLETQFRSKMSAIYDNPKMMAELKRRLKALNNEMETMAQSAEKAFANLESVGLTPAQKAKLKPVVQEAHADLKKTVAKSSTGSTKDKATRDEAIAKYKQARHKVKQELTPAQREKLAQKMSAE